MGVQITHRGQHLLKHKAQEVSYVNATSPSNNNIKLAIDQLYTLTAGNLNWKTSVADKASLPLVGNTLNDARIVEDNGAGIPAIYVCIATTGDVDTQWLQLSEISWGTFLSLQDTPNLFTTSNAIYTVNTAGDAVSETAVVLTEGTNTFNIAKGNASLDIAAGATLNIDANLTVGNAVTLASTNAGTIDFGATSKTLTISETCTIDQNLAKASSPTFAGLTVVNAINEFSKDNTLGGNSDTALPTEKAVKGYVDTTVGDYLDIATYDPTAISGDVFDMANMVEATNAKVLTSSERTKIGNSALSGANTDITSLQNVALYVGRDADNLISWAVDDILTIIIGGVTSSIASISTGAGDNDKLVTKGYVDDNITAQDLDFAGDTGTGAVNLDSQAFTIAGTANEISTSASSQTLTIGLPSAVTIATSLTVTNGAVIDADGIDLVTGNAYEINGTSVLNATTLGANIVNSSLTNVGTLTTLTVDDITINGNAISSAGASSLTITPTAGQKLVLDGHWGFDGVAFTAETDADTTFTAYAGKNITIEGVTFDGGVVGATTFNGNLTGDVTGNVSGSSGSCTGNAATVTGFTPASGSLTLSGADALTLTTTADTDVTLPTTGTLATLAGTEAFTNKSIGTDGTVSTLQLTEKASIELDAAGGADGDYSGITITGTAGDTIAFGETIYLKAADSEWYKTDADATATAGAVMVGIAVAASTDGNSIKILLYGQIRADAAFPDLTVGAPVYLGTTSGDIVTTAPSGDGDVVKVVGHALTANEILFNPSPDWIVITA